MTRTIDTIRFSLVSTRLFEDVLAVIDAAVGHPDAAEFKKALSTATTFDSLTSAVSAVTGPTELMEFTRFDIGMVLGKGRPDPHPRSIRLLIGNPVTMRSMAELVPDAGAYAPITVLIDERQDGVHVSYDRISSSIASYGNVKADAIARHLDSTVEAILAAAVRA